MADFPLFGGGRIQTIGADTTTSNGTSISAGATINTKGSWTQLAAATTFNASSVMINWDLSSSTDMLLDIGIGAAASETVLIPNILLAGNASAVGCLMLPLSIPAGSRVAARLQSGAAFDTTTVICHLHAGCLLTPSPLSRVDAYGTATATSSGTTIDPGGTANTLGAWVQLSASTARPMRGLFFMTSLLGTAASSVSSWLIDIGIGGSGSEVVLLSGFRIKQFFGSNPDPHNTAFIPIDIPAGVRLAARAQYSGTATPDRLIGIAVYGVS